MNRNFLKTNVVLAAIVIYIILYGTVVLAQPSFLYKPDSTLRQFGVGYRNKTILPMWLLSLILGIVSYLAVIYYMEYQQLI
tara:strand:+ start:20224 stop:20466 length:243 start_codon:yes stop_codon:yes gene_type:complete